MKALVAIISLFIVFSIAAQLSMAAGLSVLPAFVNMNVIRGQHFNISVTVKNPGDFEQAYRFKPLENISKWVAFYNTDFSPIDNVTIPAESSEKIIARFSIPTDVPNGEYDSLIYIETIAANSTGNNTGSLSIRVPILISFDVTGSQFITGKVLNITTSDTEINKLLRINTEFRNTGDVIATPKINVVFKKNGETVGSIVRSDTSVDVNNQSTIMTEWDTTGQTVGDYVANVKVYLGTSLLKESDLEFKILERGSFSAEGQVESVKAPSEMFTGEVGKIEATFRNTGQIDVLAKISGEVYKDSNLVDTIEGDETLVRINSSDTLIAYFQPSEEGSYLIKGSVVYEGKKESIDDISINVGKGSSVVASETDNPPTGYFIFDTNTLFVIFIVFAVVLIIAGILRDRSKRNRKSDLSSLIVPTDDI